MRKIHSEAKIESAIKELKKYSVRREITKTAKRISESMKNISPEVSYLKIVESADQIYNEKLIYLKSAPMLQKIFTIKWKALSKSVAITHLMSLA